MSTTPEKAEATQEQQAAALAVHLAAMQPGGPPLSLRHLHEPCAKHAEKPPGEQSWNADGSKKRDPNGYDHACPDCQANAEIRLEA